MNFQEVTNPIKRVRILKSTYTPCELSKGMIGGEFEVKIEYHDVKKVAVYSKDKGEWCHFNLSDVQFLTPLKYRGVSIGIGDEVILHDDWRKVYGFHWYDGAYHLETVDDNDFESSCFTVSEFCVKDHKTLQPQKETLSGQKATMILEDGTKHKIIIE